MKAIMSSIKKIAILTCLAAGLSAGSASAADNGWLDSASFEFGTGKKVTLARVAVQSDWDARWFASNGRHVGGYWDVSAAYWRGTAYRNVPGQRQTIGVVGIMNRHDNCRHS